jgi:simple sugar transport system permease protein
VPPTIAKRALWAGRALGSPLGAIIFAFVLGAIVVAVSGNDPFLAYGDLLCGGIGLFCPANVYPSFQVSETLVYTIPLILAGLSVAIAFRANLFNIGAEGQLILGAIVTTIVGVKLANWPGWILLPLVLLAGALAGAVWGGIVGVLKAVLGAHEVVTTIMLNYVAQFLLEYLIVGGPLQAPGQSSVTAPIGKGAQLPRLIPQTGTFLGLPGGVYRVHAGIFIALAAAVVFWFLLQRTVFGYELRSVGQSPRAARYAGISVSRTIIVTMLISGAFAGLAGAVVISGLRHSLTDIYRSETTGFDAITVALLGQNTAIGAVLAAFFLAALHIGGQFMQGDAGVSSNLVDALQALILFCIAANFISSLKLRLPALRQVPPSKSEVAPGVAAVTTGSEPSATTNVNDTA